MRIAIASDHAGFLHKVRISDILEDLNHEIIDFGTDSENPCDYPEFIRPAAESVAAGDCLAGVVLGGSGNGEAMVANKVRGIRCAVCWCIQSARLAREHNDANMISIGQRFVPEPKLAAILDAWLTSEFQGGRHARRIEQLD